jgi:glutamyl-Q tRNA(Asp) synthetase
VVRGADLLDSTSRQIRLQQLLGLPTPTYLHLPLALGQDGKKLGKREQSDPIHQTDPAASLHRALQFLGQNPPGGLQLEKLWAWAVDHWRTGAIPKQSVPGSSGKRK